jgi:hypothetical protein
MIAIQRAMLARDLQRRKASTTRVATSTAPVVSATQSATSLERLGTKYWWNSSLAP